MNFDIEHDFEFYCYLKASLPSEYKIVSEPSTKYYSEWSFNYRIYYKNELIKEFEGNFKEIEEGELIQEAKQLISESIMNNSDNRK